MSFTVERIKKNLKKENNEMENLTQREAEEKIVELVQERMGKAKSLDEYEKHYIAVLRENRELADIAIKGYISDTTKKFTEKSQGDPSAQVVRLIEEAMLTYNIDYEKAMSHVFKAPEHKELVQQYIDSNI